MQWTATAIGTGTIADAQAPQGPAPLTAAFTNLPEEHDGTTPFTVEIVFSEPPTGPKRPEVRSALEVEGGETVKVRKVNGDKAHRRVTIQPEDWNDVTVTLPETTDCAAQGALCTAAGGPFQGTISATVPGPLVLNVAPLFIGSEGAGTQFAIPVRLSRASTETVTVDYQTSDGTATAGADYVAAQGTLTFAPGETAKTAEVTILDDAHNEGAERFKLTLSNATGAAIWTATGIVEIRNTDHMPKAWLVRFAREAAENAFDAADERLRARPASGWSATVAGVPLGAGQVDEDARDDLDALARWLDESPRESASRKVTGRDLLTGTTFSLSASDGTPGGSAGSVWARGALSSFSGTEDKLTLEGDVSSIMLGADLARDRWAAGAMVSHSRGEGTYSEDEHGGTVDSSITGLYPYGRLALNERVTLWGIAGYGEGTLRTDARRPEDDRHRHRPRDGGAGLTRDRAARAARRRGGDHAHHRRTRGTDHVRHGSRASSSRRRGR